ncbi:MAG: molybdopterin-dependent oxidoreductase [Deferribacterales bacterium]
MASLSTLKVSRRSVLKAAGVLSAASALNAALPVNGIAKSSKQIPKDSWHFSHCRMCMRGDCPNMYRVENGVVVELKGNPKAPNNKGTMCARGNSLIQNLYNPYRVKAPMKRTNPKKGLNEDPMWVEISWEEALTTTAKTLKKVRDRDPKRFIFQVGFGDMNYFCTYLFYFAAAYGTPNYLKSNGTLCALHYAADLVQGIFPVTVSDLKYAKYVIAVGRHTGMSIGAANGGARGLGDALADTDLKYVVVDPRCTAEASKGEWLPIKPGTELPFLMTIAHTIIFEIGKYDEETMRWSTNAPYLIDTKGDYYRGKDGKPQIYDLADKKVKSFDDKTLKTPALEVKDLKQNGEKLVTGFTLVKESLKDKTPEWAAELTKIPAARLREVAKGFVDNASIGKTITLKDKNGKDKTFPLRTSSIICQRGAMGQRDGIGADLMSKICNMLVGSLDVPGGNIACARGPFLSPDKDGVVEPKMEALFKEPTWPPKHIDLYEFFPHRHSTPALAYKVAMDPKKYGVEYEIDALLTVGGNPISSTTEPYMVAESISRIPFSATLAYHYDEMAHMSDILLPSHAILEKESVNCYESGFDVFTKETLGLKMLMYRDPIPPVFDSRQSQDIIMQLCEKMGIISDFNEAMNKMGVMIGEISIAFLDKKDYFKPDKLYTVREVWDRGVQKYFGKEHTMDSLNDTGLIIQREAPADCYNTGLYAKGETRFPFYFERLKKSGDGLRPFFKKHNDVVKALGIDAEKHLAYYEAVINWRPNKINSIKSTDEYDLVSITYKTPYSPMRVGAVDQLPYLNEVGETFDPTYGTVTLSTITANEKGLKSGDTVTVESKNGKITGKLFVTELLLPGVIGVAGSMGRLVKSAGASGTKYLMYNKLTCTDLADCDPVAMGITNPVPVKIYKVS